jgi:hypothetical protein
MGNNIREDVDFYKRKYSPCQLIKKIAEKYEGSEFLRDPMYIALTEDAESAARREKEEISIKSKNDRIEREEIYDSELYEDDEED